MKKRYRPIVQATGLAAIVAVVLTALVFALRSPSAAAPANGYYALAFGYLDGKAIAGLPLGHTKDLASCEKAVPVAEAELLSGAPPGAGITVVCVPVPDKPDRLSKQQAPAGDAEGDGGYRPQFNT